MKCVPKTSCDFDGVITENFIQDTPELDALRVPLIPCINLERSNMVDVCCRDPTYKDPWPQGMNKNVEYEDDYGEDTSGTSQDYNTGGGGGHVSSQDYGEAISSGSQDYGQIISGNSGDYPSYPDYQDYQETTPHIDIRNHHSKKKKKGNAYG